MDQLVKEVTMTVQLLNTEADYLAEKAKELQMELDMDMMCEMDTMTSAYENGFETF